MRYDATAQHIHNVVGSKVGNKCYLKSQGVIALHS